MKTGVIKFYPKKTYTDAQYKRFDAHKPSVYLNTDGTIATNIKTIVTPDGHEKELTEYLVAPGPAERVAKLEHVPHLFKDLRHVNLILTNACNLSCSYCYEQHSHDYGRFTPETLKQVYDFQLNANKHDGKLFQFFGGEPLIHKKLILQFLRQYAEDLRQNTNRQNIGMITNGLLLTPEFIAEYFSHKFTCMSISLDTLRADVDHREIGQEKINRIVEMVGLIPEFHKNNHMVSVRCTIAVENARYLEELATTLYAKGLRTMVIHPLTMSSKGGFIQWSTSEWDNLHKTIVHLLQTLPGFEIQFSEGVGQKEGNNCMVGSDMIAVDATGDYSGCYFFTNQKTAVPHTMLGNILHNLVYVDRYHNFQTAYEEMFIKEEQCKTCDLRGFCYQCPAGNTDTGTGQLFRPDDMCQNIVRLFLALQDDIVHKVFIQKYNELRTAVNEMGEQKAFAKAIVHLMYKHITGQHITSERVSAMVNDLPDYQETLGVFWTMVESNETSLPEAESFVPYVGSDDPLDVKTFYERWQARAGHPSQASSNQTIDDINKRVFYLTLIHMLVLNKADGNKPHKIVKL
jgi:radical SAM protein with 4Fe4S-binding SPASM domain